MMSDDAPEAPVGADSKVARSRHRCIVLCLLFIAACAIAAIVLPLVLNDDCDCDSVPNIRGPETPTTSPVSPPTGGTPTAPNGPTTAPSPTNAPGPTNSPTSVQLGHFIRTFLVPLSGEEVFEDRSSPQFLAADFLTNQDRVGARLGNTEQLGDRYALTTFYYAMDGDDSWLSCSQGDTDCATGNSWLDPQVNHCEWSAIRCNSEGNGLVGTIPPEISLLTEIENFVAVNNLISGSFPDTFGQLKNLRRVVLATNRMTGSLPEGFLEDSPLELLFLSDNNFSGGIPSSLGDMNTLTQIQLSNNRFDGGIPSELANLELLSTLDLSENDRLRGTIPSEIFGMRNLENLFLNSCTNLQGTLSTSIGGLRSITGLRLGETGLRGPLPSALFTLNSLAELDLSGAGFSGSLSQDFSRLSSSLRVLRLSGNSFTGTIPEAFDDLVLLNVLELEENDLTGEISDTVCSRQGGGRNQLNVVTVDCEEVQCTCCTNCD